jgi:hypothetical protein
MRSARAWAFRKPAHFIVLSNDGMEFNLGNIDLGIWNFLTKPDS